MTTPDITFLRAQADQQHAHLKRVLDCLVKSTDALFRDNPSWGTSDVVAVQFTMLADRDGAPAFDHNATMELLTVALSEIRELRGETP